MTYTSLALVGIALALVLDLLVLRTALVRRRVFWTTYAIVFAFQLVVNGWLTGRNVVVYDETAIIGRRLVFAPVEDLAFGFSLVLQSLSWWVWWGRRLSATGRGEPGREQALRRAGGPRRGPRRVG